MKHSITISDLTNEAFKQAQGNYHEQRGQYLEYISQLFWWNKRVNLISRDVSHETMVRHVQHSLLLTTLEEVKNAEHILDTGSGGGLPAIPLSIHFRDKKVVANDIVSKKMMAIKQIGRKLGCNNFDTITTSIKNYELSANELIVSKHAFKVGELIEYLEGKGWRQIIFLKGENEAKEEIEEVSFALDTEIIRLDPTISDPFYKGKAIVKVRRKDEKL